MICPTPTARRLAVAACRPGATRRLAARRLGAALVVAWLTTTSAAALAQSSASPGQAPADAAAALTAADQALGEGRLDEAIHGYEALLAQRGPQPDLYYNLALALERQGDLARALLNFERSQALEPDATDVEAHIAHVRGEIQREQLAAERTITPSTATTLASWRYFRALDPDALAWTLIIAWTLSFGLLTARRHLASGWRRDVALVGAGLGLVTAALCGGYLIGHARTDDTRPAIVLERRPVLFEFPSDDATPTQADDLYPGALVEVLEVRERWLRVELVDGTRGWVRQGALEDVRVDRWPPGAALARE